MSCRIFSDDQRKCWAWSEEKSGGIQTSEGSFELALLREHASRALGVQGEQAHESVRPLHANFVMPFPHLQ